MATNKGELETATKKRTYDYSSTSIGPLPQMKKLKIAPDLSWFIVTCQSAGEDSRAEFLIQDVLPLTSQNYLELARRSL